VALLPNTERISKGKKKHSSQDLIRNFTKLLLVNKADGARV